MRRQAASFRSRILALFLFLAVSFLPTATAHGSITGWNMMPNLARAYGASPAEAWFLACTRYVESHDQFAQFDYYPNGGGDGGGAWQYEWTTWLTATAIAHVRPTNQTLRAQYKVTLDFIRAGGASNWQDGC